MSDSLYVYRVFVTITQEQLFLTIVQVKLCECWLCVVCVVAVCCLWVLSDVRILCYLLFYGDWGIEVVIFAQKCEFFTAIE